ncbi:VWA domain-containing protein [Anatilimnocola floriformis]|uniref:VWA domain-containing protein n=1 Tax=Anatilimnocola floriformis TaxID=2948575 RepID=UPI0020C5A7FE|nr:VWA domain-containing protein [Anatilimnocola floriformis]
MNHFRRACAQVLQLAMVIAFTACLTSGVAAGELDVKFKGARQKILNELRSNKPEIRAAAIAKLRDYPVADCADLLLTQGALSSFPDVSLGCQQTLQSFADSEAVGKFLVTSATSDFKLRKADPSTKVKLEVLFASTVPSVRTGLAEVVDLAGQSPAGLLIVANVVDELGDSRNPEHGKILLQVHKLPLFSGHSGLRRALIQALCKLNDKEAVTQLVEMQETARGEMRADIDRRLLQLSGLSPMDRPDLAAWWKDKQATFVFPEGPVKPNEYAAKAGQPSYYGLPLYGSKIVFIADYSGSMSGPKLAAAQRELTTTISQLPGDVTFNVIAFHSEVFVWKRELQAVTPQSREAATKFVASGQAAAMTNSYEALHTALQQDCDAIYFLTDGSPTVGKITNPRQIVEVITSLNRVRRATIHCIGIGADGGFSTFLEELAAKNFGAYRAIN